jgi:acetolactate synthase II small subunit
MHYQLTLLLTNTPAAIERVLQTTRYRGFTLHHCQMHTDSGDIQLNMRVSGEYPIHLLTSQLNKLYDVIELVFDSTSCRAEIDTAEPVSELALG